MEKYSKIKIHPLSSAARERRLLTSEGGYYEVSPAVVELLEILQQKPTEEEAIAAYREKRGGKYSEEQVREAIRRFIDPMLQPKQASKRTFLYEKELFSRAAIDWFSDRFRFLFNRWCMGIVLALAVALDAWFFFGTDDLLSFGTRVNAYQVAGLLCFMLASSFFHELGHASACKHFGVEHGGVGFGLYLNFPVLYTDVTEVWKLRRGQRCVVNLAGVYFQAYWLIVLVALYQGTHSDMVRYLILVMNLGFLMTLNPFFKFDGYWIASDLLGVPNLRERSKELIGYCYRRIRRLPVYRKPYLLQIRAAERYGLLAYSVVVNFFMAFYFCYVLPRFLYRFVQTFPDEVNELILYLANNMLPPFALLRNLLTQLLFIGLIGYLAYKMLVRPVLKRYGRG